MTANSYKYAKYLTSVISPIKVDILLISLFVPFFVFVLASWSDYASCFWWAAAEKIFCALLRIFFSVAGSISAGETYVNSWSKNSNLL